MEGKQPFQPRQLSFVPGNAEGWQFQLSGEGAGAKRQEATGH